MSELRNFVADLLERKGAAVDKAVDPDGLEVLAPAPVQKANAPSCQTPTSGTACGRPSARTVMIQ